MEKIRIGIIGAGHWGPNLIRIFLDEPSCELIRVADKSARRCSLLADHYPGLSTTCDPDEVLNDPSIEAVVVSTPPTTHFSLTRRALENGKHVLVEKPVTTSVKEAVALDALARAQDTILMVGHTFLFNRAFQILQQTVHKPEFGKICYIYSRRLNLGPVREDVHAGWDLSVHDISMILQLLQSLPMEVTASAQCFVRPHLADVVFATLFFKHDVVAHVHSSWVDPQKVRQFVVVGEHQMVTFDDMSLGEPFRIFNRGFRRVPEAPSDKVIDTLGLFRVELRQGEVIIPPVTTGEPLRTECLAFLDSIRKHQSPATDGRFGADVVRVLEAIDKSLAMKSQRVPVDADDHTL